MIKVSTLKKNPQIYGNIGFSGIIDSMKPLGKAFICGSCGIAFYSRKADKNRQPKYCSKKCFGQTRKLHIPCQYCGKEIQNPLGVSIRNRKHCSRKCQSDATKGRVLSPEWRKALSEGRKASAKCKGPNLYNWKGGAEHRREVNRLKYHHRKAQGKLDPLFLQVLIRLQCYRCLYCEQLLKKGRSTHIEHLVPVTRGGTNEWFNLVYACQSCNSKKHDKTLAEFAIEHRRPDWINRSEVSGAAYQIASRIRNR